VPAELSADTVGCDSEILLRARIVNRGRAGVAAGIPVTFYRTDMGRERLGTVLTTRRLLPGEAETVRLTFSIPAGMEATVFSFEVVINDPTDAPVASLRECRPDNNDAAIDGVQCPQIF